MGTSVKDFKSFIVFILSFCFLGLPFYAKYKYKCNSCKYEFNLKKNHDNQFNRCHLCAEMIVERHNL